MVDEVCRVRMNHMLTIIIVSWMLLAGVLGTGYRYVQ